MARVKALAVAGLTLAMAGRLAAAGPRSAPGTAGAPAPPAITAPAIAGPAIAAPATPPATAPDTSPAVPPAEVVRLFADTDDDDADGVRDQDGAPGAVRDVWWAEGRGGRLVIPPGSAPLVRLIERQVPSARGRPPSIRIGLEGLAPGRMTVDLGAGRLDIAVCELRAVDARHGAVDLAVSHASLSRTLPTYMATHMDGSTDVDALSWLAVCPPGLVPAAIRFESFSPSGERLDLIAAAPLLRAPCPAAGQPGRAVPGDLECGTTGPIRATADLMDRAHPAAIERSLRAEVGGRIVLDVSGQKAASIRVGGPRDSAVGPIDRLRASLRFHVVRAYPSGGAAVGGDDAGAVEVVRAEAHTASMLWGQCGIHFGPGRELRVDVVDPPPRHLVAIGCEAGLPASGGIVSFVADGKPIHTTARPGDVPIVVAEAVASAVRAAGLRAVVSPNTRVAFGALGTADVLVRRADGALAALAPEPGATLSTDPTLGVCLGAVNLADGLTHFDDLDAVAGTLEERTLVKAYQDDDPSTIEVFFVPSFSKTGRIGESFIDTDGSGIKNVVIVDRTGIRAGSRSYAFAHELGHVLLDLPGHPDDFGVDRPWMLMDADATDASIFGPRRLSVEDCERAVRQSGPRAAVPLLTPWPLYRAK
jgi:hypothetical protein